MLSRPKGQPSCSERWDDSADNTRHKTTPCPKRYFGQRRFLIRRNIRLFGISKLPPGLSAGLPVSSAGIIRLGSIGRIRSPSSFQLQIHRWTSRDQVYDFTWSSLWHHVIRKTCHVKRRKCHMTGVNSREPLISTRCMLDKQDNIFGSLTLSLTETYVGKKGIFFAISWKISK